MTVVIIVLGLHKRRLKMSRNFLGPTFRGTDTAHVYILRFQMGCCQIKLPEYGCILKNGFNVFAHYGNLIHAS